MGGRERVVLLKSGTAECIVHHDSPLSLSPHSLCGFLARLDYPEGGRERERESAARYYSEPNRTSHIRPRRAAFVKVSIRIQIVESPLIAIN